MKTVIGFSIFMFIYVQLAIIGIFCPDDRSFREYAGDIKECITDVWGDREFIFA